MEMAAIPLPSTLYLLSSSNLPKKSYNENVKKLFQIHKNNNKKGIFSGNHKHKTWVSEDFIQSNKLNLFLSY